MSILTTERPLADNLQKQVAEILEAIDQKGQNEFRFPIDKYSPDELRELTTCLTRKHSFYVNIHGGTPPIGYRVANDPRGNVVISRVKPSSGFY